MHDHCLPPGLEQLLHRQFKIAMRILASIAAAADVHLLTTDPAIGAVRLALAEARGGASIPTYKTRDHLAL